jgi:hypothetical protein
MNEIFSDQGIEELRKRLGLAGQDEGVYGDSELDASLFEDESSTQTIPSPIESLPEPPRFVGSEGISFPQNISVDYDAITFRVGPDGATVADIIVQFDDVSGAVDYPVKYVSLT